MTERTAELPGGETPGRPGASARVAGELHIGIDAEKVVVSPQRLRMRTGRAHRTQHGSVIEVVPAAPSGRSRESRVAVLWQLGLGLLVGCVVLNAFGIAWQLPALASIAGLVVVGWVQARAARAGVLATPRNDQAHVLLAREERIAYERAVAVSHRIRRTWPDLRALIDPVDADRTLARGLEQLAALLARRQEIRVLRDELIEAARMELPHGSPAAEALAAQRSRVEELWRDTGLTANRMLRSIAAAAHTGETLLREQQVGRTARDAELAISRLAAVGATGPSEAGPELAERTAAVVEAYRELATWV
ncbi:hypothetical protein [Krasilnikovia sp. MM14-A1004]|uniref:hypothetical protein n=1 Tax=Krasilnikovia sp. MM14-A1004 TaxID=3373541 RepID=UPI00399CFBBD